MSEKTRKEAALKIYEIDRRDRWCRPWLKIKDAPGWVSNGAMAVHVGDVSGCEFTGQTADGKTVFAACNRERPAQEIKELRIPSEWRTETRRDCVEEGCDGCDCGTCRGTPDRYRTVTEEVRDVGQVVYEDMAGRRFRLDPDFAAILDGLDVHLAEFNGGHMACGYDGGDLVAVVMGMNDGIKDQKEMDKAG